MSNFVVSARKYRPNRFDEVVGQEHVSQTLKNALQNDHLAHAFLFCGPRGVGKTTCARILAKVLNCTNRTDDYEACNTCSSCEAFNGNASFNITELDAASNNSVEHIRALVEQVRFQPQQGNYKVYIIDEVHMLSNSAFNAFLKTLEEPPPYAIFILATTEKHKIIPTILSRCQIFDFRRIQVPAIVSHLEDICQQEGIKASKDALHIIGQKADGALRDALSIFDRMVSFSGKEITYEGVIENLNILDYDYFFQLVDALLIEDMPSVLNLFDTILKKGFESDIFINGLAEHLRNVLVCKNEESLQLLEVSDGLQERYRQQAGLAPTSFLLSALNLCNDCDVNYRMARNKRLHVEMALIKMTYINRAVNLSKQTPPALEKKTPDQSTARVNSSPESSPSPQPVSATSTEKNSTTQSTTQSTTPETTPPQAAKPEVTPPPPADPVKNLGLSNSLKSKYSTPSLSISSVEEEVAKEQEASKKEKPPLDLEVIKTKWTQYATNSTSPTLRNAMNNGAISLEGESITVEVGSTMLRNLIQSESNLMGYLRKELDCSTITLIVKVDPSKVPTDKAAPVKKILTTTEKFENMKEVNPLVEDVVKRFGLKPDND